MLGTVPFDLLLSSCNVHGDGAVTPGSCAVVRTLGCFKLLRIVSMGKQIGEWQSLYVSIEQIQLMKRNMAGPSIAFHVPRRINFMVE